MASPARVATGIVTGGLSEVAKPLAKNLLKTPTPPEGQKPATADSNAVQTALAEATARRSRARGFASTILSDFSSKANQDLKQTFGS